MKLIVNGRENEDIQPPEPGQTVGEYVDNLNEQFGKINRVVQVEMVNDKDFKPSLSSWESDRIDRMELSVKPIEEVVVNTLMSLAQYLDQALENLPDILENWSEHGEEDIHEYRDQLEEAFTTIDKILSSVTALSNVGDRLEPVEEIQEEVGVLHRKLTERNPESLHETFSRTRDMFSNLRQEIESVVQTLSQQEESLWRNLSDIADSIELRIEQIPEIVESLQTGGDEDSFQKIDNIADDLSQILEFIEKLDEAGKVRMVLSPEGQEELNKAHTELEDGIDELQEAFENRDVIMICDIIEYEILPYLKNVNHLLQEINVESST